MTPELQARIEELIDAHWSAVKAAAADVGITEKPAGSTWNDLADEIAIAEFTRDGKPLDVPSEPVEKVEPTKAEALPQPQLIVPVVSGVYSTQFYKDNGIPYCSLCGEKLLSRDGKPFCPENFPSTVCPRLGGTTNV